MYLRNLLGHRLKKECNKKKNRITKFIWHIIIGPFGIHKILGIQNLEAAWLLNRSDCAEDSSSKISFFNSKTPRIWS
jgi:hypothetical protein